MPNTVEQTNTNHLLPWLACQAKETRTRMHSQERKGSLHRSASDAGTAALGPEVPLTTIQKADPAVKHLAAVVHVAGTCTAQQRTHNSAQAVLPGQQQHTGGEPDSTPPTLPAALYNTAAAVTSDWICSAAVQGPTTVNMRLSHLAIPSHAHSQPAGYPKYPASITRPQDAAAAGIATDPRAASRAAGVHSALAPASGHRLRP
jgi:hypothetical protein